jgi:shikimate dehydrogenase
MSLGKTFVLIGHPVAHSVSPAIHGAAYRALGVPHRYELADCPDETAVRAVVERLRRGEIAGANVTVPWKRLALSLADRAEDSARRTAVANVLSLDVEGRVAAANTDAVALAEEIAVLRAAPTRAVVIGGGGAAQAAVVACQMLGVRHVAVSSRGWNEHEPRSAWKQADTFSALGATPCVWPDPLGAAASVDFLDAVRRAHVIIQATSAGMHGAGPGGAVSDWIPWSELAAGAVALDVVYNPPLTPFLEAARRANVRHTGGLGMLVRQAAAAIRIWLGSDPAWVAPNLRELMAAAESALSQRRT